MAVSSSAIPENPHHVRSMSMPSQSHPLALNLEEEIIKLKTWVSFSSSTSSLTAEMICNGLGHLKCLYDSVDDILQLPLSQQALVYHQHQKWAEEVLDKSVRLLDICGTTRDILSQTKESVKDLRSALRRRGGDLCLESKVRSYICSRKKMTKDICKCIGALKQMDKKHGSTSLLDQDPDLSIVGDVMSITISVLQAILSFMSTSAQKPKPRKWLLVSKLMHKGQVACEEDDASDVNEVESADTALFALSGQTRIKGIEIEKVNKALKRLEGMEISIDGVEAQLECMFRCMIQTRVSLLNIITH
ncbi:uncharacterized protein LOC131244574 [Magnolia sinica]|uniref:uncharacterized protein LOC131244574 n=1 Tax=Magnolia sinica TaxID=86752 RepID=UPI00265B1BFE|nr:uncharacterized protein LOC131244574 [Magnolia sinica]